MVQPVPAKAVLRPAKAPAYVHSMSSIYPPTSPYPTFFARAKPILKVVVPTDNVQPNSDDAKCA